MMMQHAEKKFSKTSTRKQKHRAPNCAKLLDDKKSELGRTNCFLNFFRVVPPCEFFRF